MSIVVRLALTLSMITGMAACTKDVGKDAKLHPPSPEPERAFVGKFSVSVDLYQASWNGMGVGWSADTTFTDTLRTEFDHGSAQIIFKHLYTITFRNTVNRYSKSMIIPNSGIYTFSTWEKIVFRNDSLFYTIDNSMNKQHYKLKITGKKLVQ